MRASYMLVVAFAMFVALSTLAQAETLSFFGQAFSTSGSAVTGLKAYLYGETGSKWFGPSISDSNGRFSFFGLASGKYLLRIYVNGNKSPAFQQEVSVPGKITLHISSDKLEPSGVQH
ncbi:MAG: hypothetical protein ABI431_05610 [Candidatus Tumulicola sp.]